MFKPTDKIIYKAIVGSRSYGTDVETSDTDYKGIYNQHINDLIGFGYIEQVSINADETYYELRRFVELLQNANPTVLELLYTDPEFIIETSPQFQILVDNRKVFLTKKALSTFSGYAIQQIKKAKGLDKKMNWEKSRLVRKTPIDFIHYYQNGKTIPLTKWLEQENKQQDRCGLVGLSHFKDGFSLYYDSSDDRDLKYRGIQSDKSDAIKLSSVPKSELPIGIVSYNKDGYSTHCKDYNQYQEWLKNRNIQRYVDNTGHDQQIDGKNMMHCRRLLDMALEIATTGELTVKRPNREYLLDIRRGKVNLDDIIIQAESDIELLNQLQKDSDLPDCCSLETANEILLKIRNYES